MKEKRFLLFLNHLRLPYSIPKSLALLLNIHIARHTNATLLIYNGVNITTVQKLLGHRNVSTTQIYSEIMKETIVKDLVRCTNKT